MTNFEKIPYNLIYEKKDWCNEPQHWRLISKNVVAVGEIVRSTHSYKKADNAISVLSLLSLVLNTTKKTKMTNYIKQFQMLFQSPLEPIYTCRDNGKCIFELPDSHYLECDRGVKEMLQERYANSEHIKVNLYCILVTVLFIYVLYLLPHSSPWRSCRQRQIYPSLINWVWNKTLLSLIRCIKKLLGNSSDCWWKLRI